MSCGDPHEVDCTEVLALVCAYLDGELNPQDRERVRQHLEDESCTGCLREFGLDRVVKQLVGRCCQGTAAPSEVEQRLRERLRTVTYRSSTVESVAVDPATGSVNYQRTSYESITSTD
jgi:mycothiol system anti-sigma-R factor